MVLIASIYFLAFSGIIGISGATSFSKVTDTLKFGIRLASTFLDSDQNHIFASILQKFGNFRHHEGVNQSKDGPETAIPFFLKLMGFNTTKLEDLAFDGFIFLTHLIGETLIDLPEGNSRRQRSKDGANFNDYVSFQYLIKQPKVLGLLTQMEDANMVEFILNESKRKLKGYPEEDVQCIPLLVCKMYPFVRGMQRSLKFFMNKNIQPTDICFKNVTHYNLHRDDCSQRILWENSDAEGRMFFFLPSLDEVIDHGDVCDDRFPKCVY